MTKKIKVTFLACLTMCLAIFAIAFAACTDNSGNNGGDNGGDTLPEGAYQITVTYEDGSPVTGVYVQLCTYDANGELISCLLPVAVDDNGVAVFSSENGVVENTAYHIEVEPNSMPDGYTCGEQVTQSGVYEYTLVLVAE